MQQSEDLTLIRNKYKRNLHIKKVKYNLEIFRCLFYLVGDGSFQKGIYLSNINYRLHKDFMRIFENYFDIKRNEWILSQTYNEKFKKTKIGKANQFW